MWKKFPGRDRGKGRQSIQIGQPTLVESTYDVEQLDRAQNLSPIDEPAQSPLSPGEAYYKKDIRPSRVKQNDQEIKQQLKLPTMNFGKHNPNDPKANRPSVAASSVYSQRDDDQISPPASPYRRPAYDDGRVSPIDEHSPSGYGDTLRPNKSHIPVPRKITPKSKEWTQNVGKGAPLMWDDYSGEPTFDGAGKQAQVKPGEFDYRSGLKPTSKLPQTTALSNTAHKTSFKDKATRLAKQSLAVDTRPPWKGGSGRHAIVEVPQDKPGQTIPQPKRPEEKRAQTPQSASPTLVGAYSPETNPKTALPDIEHPALRNDVSSARRESESPIADLSSQSYTNANAYPSPDSERNATPTDEYSYSSPAAAQTLLGRHLELDQSPPQPSFTDNELDQSPPNSSFTDEIAPLKTRSNHSNNIARESPEPNNDSRFSWSTKATSVYQQSAPPSPPPPMPTKYTNGASPAGLRYASESPVPIKASVLDRGHPTRRLEAEAEGASPSARSFSAGSTLRKPVSTFAVQPPLPSPEIIKQQFPMTDWRSGVSKQRASSMAPSILSTTSSQAGKSLPKTPKELSSPDLIASLQAQQDDLSQQRRNIQRVIYDLEKPEAKNPLTNSFRMIRENERRLEQARNELSDVVRRDHDLGMRLHRAWKRKERDDPNTPGSVFWVRRATAGI